MPDSRWEKREEPAIAGGQGSRQRLVFLLAAVSVLLLGGCKQQEAPTVATVALCRGTNLQLPLMVAEKQGFFSGQGLSVSVREFTMGRDSLEAMLKGECDFATAGEPPVVEYAGQRDDLRILASLQSTDNMVRILGRADRGIGAPMDLRGKRIGTVKGTNAHYFLDLFLEKHGLASGDVAIVFMKSDGLLAALTSGRIDAISMTHNVIAQAQQALQDKAVLMESHGLCRNYVMLLTTTGLLEKRPGVAVRFLRAVDQAEEFIRQNPAETLALAQSVQKGTPAEVKQLLESYRYQLTLEHALLMGLEDTARWTMQQDGDGQGGPAPNFLKRIDSEPLRAVRPDGVRLGK